MAAPTNVAVTNVAERVVNGGVVPLGHVLLVGDPTQLGVDEFEGALGRIFLDLRIKRVKEAASAATTALGILGRRLQQLSTWLEGKTPWSTSGAQPASGPPPAHVGRRDLLEFWEAFTTNMGVLVQELPGRWPTNLVQASHRQAEALSQTLQKLPDSWGAVSAQSSAAWTVVVSVAQSGQRAFFAEVDPDFQRVRMLEKMELLDAASLVFSTVATTARPSDMLKTRPFTSIFVDEACQVTISSSQLVLTLQVS